MGPVTRKNIRPVHGSDTFGVSADRETVESSCSKPEIVLV